MNQTPGQIGDYQILASLSAGGMGEVLLARHQGIYGFEKMVAIKVIRFRDQADRQQMRAMFMDEAKLMARLNHASITQVYDFGEEGDQLFLVMEYVTGISFSELARRRPPPRVAMRAMAEVCRGLYAAHTLADNKGRRLSVVHRDISPQNLMLTFDGQVKILDFGIAWMREREAQTTQLGSVKGKPAYMSPEQVKSEPVDHRTDIFACSIVLYELLCHRRLFATDNLIATFHRIVEEQIVPPADLVSGLPAGLSEVVMRGLERDPDRRFQSAREMAQALEAVVVRSKGTTLVDYATEVLKPEFTAQQNWLRQTISEVPESAAATVQAPVETGRPAGIATQDEVFEPLSTVQSEVLADPGVQTQPVKSRRRLWVATFLVSLVAGLAVTLVILNTGVPDTQPPPAEPVQPVMEPVKNPPGKIPPVEAAPQVKKPVAKKPPKRRPKRIAVKQPVPPEPPEEAVVVKPVVYGFLTVAAHPYARVLIDGKLIGTTPVFDHKLPVGPHEVQLISPASGSVRLKKTVMVKKDQTRKVILDKP